MKDFTELKEGAKVYELGFLVLPSIIEEKLGSVVEKISEAIKKAGGEEIESEAPFKQELAYTMSKTIGASRYVVNEAYIGWTKFTALPDEALAIKKSLEEIDELLRTLLIIAPRESDFTFAKAKLAQAEKLAEASREKDQVEEVSSPVAETVVE